MALMSSAAPGAEDSSARLESTAVLLDRVRSGDEGARERLFTRVLPTLHRWAHRRLPEAARDLADTEDIVQVTVSRALARLQHFEHRGEGAFLGYLRQILFNVIRDERRRVARHPRGQTLDETMADPAPSLLDRTIDRDTLERYERALASLGEEAREAVLLRVEFGYSHLQIAEALGKPSADAARMTVARAIVALARRMGRGDDDEP
jgi:RNA polymerase sigma-70 factor (ECF subfamily)